MFFAYNNGITATAEHIETRQGDNGVEITQLRNFQIVNGGQTTGSIYNASLGKKDAADLSDVFVPMKLSVIDPEKIDEVVPLISKYANSQNSVNAADFSANHPFHVRIEEFSRRIYAPPPAGSMTQSKWFYERARGQYQQSRASLTAAERRKHDIEYPRSQRFAKTDLAKYMNVWLDKPHIVSRGAQKNFCRVRNRYRREMGTRIRNSSTSCTTGKRSLKRSSSKAPKISFPINRGMNQEATGLP